MNPTHAVSSGGVNIVHSNENDISTDLSSEDSLDHTGEMSRVLLSEDIVLGVSPPNEVTVWTVQMAVIISIHCKMAVMAIHRGLKTKSTIQIEFNIGEAEHALISKWNYKKNSTEDMAESLCVSLACYTYANLQIILGWGSGRPSTEELAIHCQSSWPRAGGLIMEVKYKEGRQKFPLSPPFAVTPDNLVDLSPFVETGKNILLLQNLHQPFDISDRVFVLHIHVPTPLQLQEVSRRRQKDQDWKAWLLHMAQPFNVPRPIWDDAQ